MHQFKHYLRTLAIVGNVLFVLWILFIAMDEDFKGTLPEQLSGIGLTGLLIVNSTLFLNMPLSTTKTK
jgi:cytochrome c biogenesis factor